MAQDTVLIDVKVNTQQVAERLSDAIAKVAKLKDEQKALKAEIEAGNDVNGQYAQQLAETNAQLENETRTVKSYTAMLQAANITEVSENETLDQQRQKLNTLQKAYAGLTEEQKRNSELGKNLSNQIKQVADSVKAQEQAIGDARRNVGNYTESIIDAVKQMGFMGPAIGKINGGLNTLKVSMNVLKAHPLLAILAGLITIFNKIKDSIAGNAENMAKFRESMSAFEPIANAVGDVIAWLGKQLATFVGWLGKAITWLTNTQEEYKEMLALAQEENQLIKDKLELKKKEADYNKEIAEYMRIARDTSKADNARMHAVEEIAKREKELADNRRNIAEREFELIKKRNDANKQTSEDAIEKENEAYIAWRNAEIEFQNTMIRVDRIRNEVTKEIRAAEEERHNAQLEFIEKEKKEFVKAEEEKEKKLKEYNDYLEEQKKKLREITKLEQGDEDAYIEKEMEVLRKYHILKTNQMMSELATFEGVERQYLQTEEQVQKARFQITTKYANDIVEKMSSADAMAFTNRYNALVDNLEKGKITEQEYISEFTKMYNDALDQLADSTSNKLSAPLKQVLKEMQDFSSETVSLAQQTSDLMKNIEQQELDEYKQANAEKQADLQARLDQGLISQTEYDAQMEQMKNELDEKTFQVELAQAKREKAIAIMQAAINTAASIMRIWAEVPKADFGATTIALTAVAAALGAAQIATIAAQPLPTKGYATGGIVPGTSYHGDKVPAQVNSGEMILTKAQQTELFNLANGNNPPYNYIAMRDAMTQALQQMPAPVLDYKEFTTFQEKIVTFDNL